VPEFRRDDKCVPGNFIAPLPLVAFCFGAMTPRTQQEENVTQRIVTRFGFWPSPFSSREAAEGALRFGRLQVRGTSVFWSEGRPAERGRTPVVVWEAGAEARDLIEPPYSARSRVHEYGGGEFLATDQGVFFVNDADQDIYLAAAGSVRRITQASETRFADLALDARRARLIAVGERHSAEEHDTHPENMLLSVPLGRNENAAYTVIISGRDFYASPRVSPDGQRLAWLAWDLPAMPWDEAELWVGELGEAGAVLNARGIAGGDGSACFQPEWSPDGTLYFVWDMDGWGNLFAYRDGEVRQISRLEGELSRPLWSFNLTTYGLFDEQCALISFLAKGRQNVGLLDLESGRFEAVDHPFTAITSVAVSRDGAAIAAVSDTREVSLYWMPNRMPMPGQACGSAGFPQPAVIRASGGASDFAEAPAPETLEFPTRFGDTVYGTLYQPWNPTVSAPSGTLPPLIISLHGGPTSNATRGRKSRTLFFTTRGFAWLDLDYSGSTGYGRPYRDRLKGMWGLRDVADTIDAARFMATSGMIDPHGLLLTGSSAGGYTVLMAIAQEPLFCAAASYYGICDLRALQRTTHKFEAGYISTLVGARMEDDEDRFLQRSAITFADRIKTPLVLFQGAEDRVVPPDQSEMIASHVRARGVRVEYHLFSGEGHGFRSAETIAEALDAEIGFYRACLRGRKQTG
jgi:dipeptidyl aminopeptidase/acylaminoacyl peptidase